MAKILREAKGLDGTLILMSDRVVLHRPGLFNFFKYGRNAKYEIPFSAISEVVFSPATMLSQGSIEIVRSGRSRDDSKGGQNTNVMKFRKRENAQFETIKEKIFELLHTQQQRRN